MFFITDAFDQNISTWDVSNVIDLNGVFKNDAAINQDLSNWNVSNITYMAQMFKHAGAFNQNLASWDITAVNTMAEMLAIVFMTYKRTSTVIFGSGSELPKRIIRSLIQEPGMDCLFRLDG